MVRLSQIYTKGGDKGKTSLGNGKRVLKSHARMQAIGSVDELNSFLGLLQVEAFEFQDVLKQIQNDLFDVGGDLCFPEEAKPEGALTITQDYIDRLEKWIDSYNKDLPELTSFVLPGGCLISAHLHVLRSTTRRAERDVCALMQEEEINVLVLQYLNRLSDLFFVLARYANQKRQGDVLWVPGGV